jgi:hypothetical protein
VHVGDREIHRRRAVALVGQVSHLDVRRAARLGAGLSGASGTGDTFLRLFDASNTQVAANDDACGVLTFFTFTATTTGTFQVRAGCFSGNSCNGTVAYTLSGPNGVSVCTAGTPCVIDLSGCTEDQKASAWQGQSTLQGTLEFAGYTSHNNWVCQTSIPQAWPVIPEGGWWCGTVVNQCTCSSTDACN